jgi:hypothetical protein
MPSICSFGNRDGRSDGNSERRLRAELVMPQPQGAGATVKLTNVLFFVNRPAGCNRKSWDRARADTRIGAWFEDSQSIDSSEMAHSTQHLSIA